jgi:hypothetical protein
MDNEVKAVVEVGEDATKTVRIISGKEAFTKYNWLRDIPSKNVSGNFRGMVIDSRWRMVYDVSSTVEEGLGKLAILISLAEEIQRSEGSINRILNTQDTMDIKASKISLQVSGICTRVLLDLATGILTTPIFMIRHAAKLNPLNEVFFGKLPMALFDMALDRIEHPLKIVTSEWRTFTLGDKPYQLISTLIR